MAGEWIKMRSDLIDDPDTLVLSDLLSIECPTTVGYLFVFWSWVDRHTADGKEINLTESMIDRKIGLSGFASALRQIGWLSGDDMSLEIPHFDRHNGNSAKARALESEAKRLRRADKKVSDTCPTKPVPKVRPEKRREENNNTTLSRGDSFPMDLEWTYDEKRMSDGLRMMGQQLEKLTPELFGKFKNHYADGQWGTQNHWEKTLRTWVANEKEVKHASKRTSSNSNALDAITG